MSFHRANLIIRTTLFLSVLALVSGSAFARPKSASSQPKHLDLVNSVTVNGTKLPPGSYNIVVENGKATFMHGKQTVATADCDWKTLSSKPQGDSLVINNNVLQEIDFNGSMEALELK